MPRRLLAIESATDWLSIALAEGDDVVLLARQNARVGHSAELLPLRPALAELGWTISQLDASRGLGGPR